MNNFGKTRERIIKLLSKDKMRVLEIQQRLGLAHSTTSDHINRLLEEGAIKIY